MKKAAFILITIFFILPLSSETFKGTCVKVGSGDTITVMKNLQKVKVRIAGIDAPENDQAYGDNAKSYIANLITGKVVKVVIKARKKNNNKELFGQVFFFGDDIGLKLVKRGLAWYSKYPVSNQDLKEAEANAKSYKMGLWSDDHPIPPWEFKEKKKETL